MPGVFVVRMRMGMRKMSKLFMFCFMDKLGNSKYCGKYVEGAGALFKFLPCTLPPNVPN